MVALLRQVMGKRAMSRVLLGAVTALMLVQATVALHAAPRIPSDQLIVPGVRIGAVTLATKIEDLTRVYGVAGRVLCTAGLPSCADAVIDPTLYYWDTCDVGLITLDHRTVEALVVRFRACFPRYKTTRAIDYAASPATVISAYGKPTAETAPAPGHTRMIYDPDGIAFTFDGGKRLIEIAVFRQGRAGRLWHLL
jgi:hypothetical protein